MACLACLSWLLQGQTLLEENFDSVTLGPNVDEGVASDMAWTATAPEGWTVDNSKMPMVDGELLGMAEWRGWTFADPAWWASVDDQRRSDFTNASGVAAIADPDEWDDKGDGAAASGTFESYLISPTVDVSSVAGGSVSLSFDFSWRPEGNQTGNVTVVFDDGEPLEIFRLDTATSSDMTNESKSIPFSVPADAEEMTVSFGMFDAGNNWFWAIDNISIGSHVDPVLPSNLVGVGDDLAKKVTLTWDPAANIVGTIEIMRGAEVIAELPIDATEYVDQSPPGIDAEGRITFSYSLRVKGEGIDAELTQEVVYSTGAARRTLFEETFDSVTLGESVDEGNFAEMVWTAEPPAGWTVDNSKMPMVDGELLGITEWRGWTFAEPTWWASVDNQRRDEFVNASGAAAIADPDEWDDNGDGASATGNFESYLISPAIDVAAEAGGTVTIVFDFSWRPEGNQKGNLTATFDGGEPQELLLLSTGNTDDKMTNETRPLVASVPAGAKEMVLTFGMFDAGNNWFWAIDNVLVTTEVVPICPSGLTSSKDETAETVTLDWLPGSGLGDNAKIQVWLNGTMVQGDLASDTTTFTNAVDVTGAAENLILDYEVRVVDAVKECIPMTATVVFIVTETKKLAQWDFEEGTGLTVSNSLGAGLEGTLVDLSEDSWTNPNFLGGALHFQQDGYIDFGTSEEDDDIRAKSSVLRPLGGITIAAWVNADAFDEWAGIAGSLFDSGSNEGGFYLNTRSGGDGAGDFSFALATESDGQLTYLRTEGVTGEWSYVVGTYDGEEQRLYLNGELKESRAASGLIDYDPAPYGFQIGTFIDDNEDDRFAGQISQVAIWDGALSEEEIFLLFKLGETGVNPDPALDGDGDGLLDAWETEHFGDLTTASPLDDLDNDQLINLFESREDTDPNNEDTDSDGVIDSTEVAFGSDATDAAAKPADNAVALLKSNNGLENWASPAVWSNGEAPSGGNAYFANGAFAATLRTPSEVANFAGDSLELFNGAQLLIQGPGVDVSNLILKSGNIVHAGADGSTTRIGGNAITVLEPSNIFFTETGGPILEIASSITGDQQLTLSLTSPFRGASLEGGTAAVSLLGDNSEFAGGWEVDRVTLIAGSSNSLGRSDVTLIDGTLDPDANLNLPEQKLTLVGGAIKLVLDQDMAFGAVSVGDLFDFPEGTYTADDLIGLGFTEDNVVDGGGTLVVGGEVDPDPDPDPEPVGDFKIIEVTLPSATQIQVRWTSAADATYTLQTSADGQDWQEAQTGIAGAANETSGTIERSGALQLIRVRKD